MKRILACVLALLLIVAFTACGKSGDDTATNTPAPANSSSDAPASAALPQKGDFAAGPAWTVSAEPTKANGPWAQSYAVIDALAQQAKVLLMDEPTASLDYGNRLQVLGAARDLARDGYTVLLSTHDPQHALWFADRALALHQGRILAYGAPREVVTADLLQQLYGRRIALIDTAQGPVVVPQEGD